MHYAILTPGVQSAYSKLHLLMHLQCRNRMHLDKSGKFATTGLFPETDTNFYDTYKIVVLT